MLCKHSSLTPKPLDEQLNQGGLSGDSPPPVVMSLLTMAPAEGQKKHSGNIPHKKDYTSPLSSGTEAP